MALADQVALAEDVVFQKAVRQVIVFAAIGYINGGAQGANAARHSLAQAVLADGGVSKLQAFVYGYSSWNTLTAANYTTNIFGFTTKVWDALSGVAEGAV